MSAEGPAPLARLVAELSRLPGIGQRTAQRLAFHILRAPDEEAAALADGDPRGEGEGRPLRGCFNLSEGPLCRICADPSRDQATICVVEEPADVIPIERTHEYRGLYHVLGGALSPIDGVDAEDLKIAELLRRVEEGEVREVVLATNPTTTGEATALHIAELLRGQVAVTRLASGLPVGADLEHADEVTLGKALAGRRSLDCAARSPHFDWTIVDPQIADFWRLASARFAKVSAWRRDAPTATGLGEGSGAGQARPRGLLAAGDAARQAARGAGRRRRRRCSPPRRRGWPRSSARSPRPRSARSGSATAPQAMAARTDERHPSLYRPGQMRRRLDQLLETNRRYGHPFALVVFDVDGPGDARRRRRRRPARRRWRWSARRCARASASSTRPSGSRRTRSACWRPNQDTVGGVQMAERLLRQLDELEAAGGLRIGISAGVVACPEHGNDADGLLHKADEAMWRARAVGQPVGVGALAN